MATTTTQPSVYLVIEGSAIAFEESGEILETVEWTDGQPDWSFAGGCDHRGVGGQAGYESLRQALLAAEANARHFVSPIVRVPAEGFTS